jgi:hypothetical protein
MPAPRPVRCRFADTAAPTVSSIGAIALSLVLEGFAGEAKWRPATRTVPAQRSARRFLPGIITQVAESRRTWRPPPPAHQSRWFPARNAPHAQDHPRAIRRIGRWIQASAGRRRRIGSMRGGLYAGNPSTSVIEIRFSETSLSSTGVSTSFLVASARRIRSNTMGPSAAQSMLTMRSPISSGLGPFGRSGSSARSSSSGSGPGAPSTGCAWAAAEWMSVPRLSRTTFLGNVGAGDGLGCASAVCSRSRGLLIAGVGRGRGAAAGSGGRGRSGRASRCAARSPATASLNRAAMSRTKVSMARSRLVRMEFDMGDNHLVLSAGSSNPPRARKASEPAHDREGIRSQQHCVGRLHERAIFLCVTRFASACQAKKHRPAWQAATGSSALGSSQEALQPCRPRRAAYSPLGRPLIGERGHPLRPVPFRFRRAVRQDTLATARLRFADCRATSPSTACSVDDAGGPAGNRTLSLRIKSPLLYQLSYWPVYCFGCQGARWLSKRARSDSNGRPADSKSDALSS